MSIPFTFHHLLIVEPNSDLAIPYIFLSAHDCKVTRTTRIDQAESAVATTQPDLICLSTSFSPLKSLHFLNTVKNSLSISLVPLIFVVDWSERVPRLLGTSWAGKVGILHSLSSKEEVEATMKRISATA